MPLLALLFALGARAESWCAYPLYAHEWGVEVFSADGQRQPPPALPAWFHGDAPMVGPEGAPVRDLPADSGVRALPVLHFYGPARWADTVPLGVEVGFREGEASAWYPQVDLLRSASLANAAPALAARGALVAQRAAREPYGMQEGSLPGDPTAQLTWEALRLTPEPATPPQQTEVPWVTALRALDALWVGQGAESERFLFYEADTHERPALRVERGEQWGPGRPHYVLHNDSPYTVHDVLVLAGEGQGFYAPAIPAGASAGFLLDAAGPQDPRALLREALVDGATPAPPTDYSWARQDCVMGRDPAVPVTTAKGHRLYEAEVDAILGIWGPRFFEAEGTVILYREDPAALAALMPLSIYTDMYHFVDLRRLGLVLWEGLDLEAMTGGGR